MNFPPLSVSPPNCCTAWVHSIFPGHVTGPTMHGCQRSVPQCRDAQPASKCMGRTFCGTEPVHPFDVLGLSSAQRAAEPTVFLNGEKLLRFCRRNPASRSPQDAGGHRGVERMDSSEFFGQHSKGRSLLNIFRPWFRRPLICVSVEPDPSRKQPRTTRICTQENSIPSFKEIRGASISAAPLRRISRLLWFKCRPFFSRRLPQSLALFSLSRRWSWR